MQKRLPHLLCPLLKVSPSQTQGPKPPSPSPLQDQEILPRTLSALQSLNVYHKFQCQSWETSWRASNVDQPPGSQFHKLLWCCRWECIPVCFLANLHLPANPAIQRKMTKVCSLFGHFKVNATAVTRLHRWWRKETPSVMKCAHSSQCYWTGPGCSTLG